MDDAAFSNITIRNLADYDSEKSCFTQPPRNITVTDVLKPVPESGNNNAEEDVNAAEEESPPSIINDDMRRDREFDEGDPANKNHKFAYFGIKTALIGQSCGMYKFYCSHAVLLIEKYLQVPTDSTFQERDD